MKAFVRAPSPRLNEGIVTHLDRQQVDVELARRQHAQYVEALRAHGWQVVFVSPPDDGPDDCPDGVFIEDQFVVVDDVAILTRTAAVSRQGERAAAEAAARAAGLRPLATPGSGRLDGGDVLQVGRTVYVGRGGRTDQAGIAGLARVVEPLGRTVRVVPLKSVLHLKSAMTALPDGRLIGLPDLIDVTGLPPISVPPEEAGAHVVPIGGAAGGTQVLVAASAPQTAGWLRRVHGCTPVVVDIAEFEKLEGCVTCLTVLWPAAA